MLMMKNLKKITSSPKLLGGCILGGLVLSLIDPSYSAVTGGAQQMQEQFKSVESVMTGGYLRLGLLGICGVSAAMAIMKQNVMGMVISGVGLLFVYLMKGWIEGTFTALI